MPLRNSDRSSVGFELHMQIPGTTGFVKIPNIGDIEVDSPSAPTETFKYVDGQTSQYSGSADPETVTCNTSFNPLSEEYRALAEAKVSGAEIPFYLISGPETVLFGNTNEFFVTTAGAVDFDATGTKPSFGRKAGVPGKFGKGDCIKATASGDYYKITGLSGTPPNELPTVRDEPHGGGSDAVATAIVEANAVVYTIVKPQIRVDFNATVTTIGAVNASPSSPVPTGTLVLAVVSGIADQWVLVPAA